MKKTFTILGLGIATGLVAYTIWHTMPKKDKVIVNTVEDLTDNIITADPAHGIISKTTAEENVTRIKNIAVNSIIEHHEEANKTINDAVNIIYRKAEVSEDGSDELYRVSMELDNLLQET